jgi:hypothetical protein
VCVYVRNHINHGVNTLPLPLHGDNGLRLFDVMQDRHVNATKYELAYANLGKLLHKLIFCYTSYFSVKLVCFVIGHWIGRRNPMRIGRGRVLVLTLPFMAAAFSAASSLSRFAWDLSDSNAYGV